jgi:hypothetical protein
VRLATAAASCGCEDQAVHSPNEAFLALHSTIIS